MLTYHPQLATLVALPPEGDRWLHELKHDGYRMGLVLEGGRARVESRRGLDWSASFRELADAAVALPAGTLLLDGEACVLQPDGRASFQALQNAFRGRRSGASGLVYFAFDLLHLDGEDLTRLPLEQRKDRLRELLARAPAGSPLRYCDHVVGQGPRVFDHARQLGAEGVVSKRRDRPHVPGRGSDWLKAKCTLRQEFVIGGFTDPDGSRSGIGALLLGCYEGEHLAFAGRVGTGKGWTGAFLEELRRGLNGLEQEACPFSPQPPRALARSAHWVRPALVVEVEFVEWTSDGSIRHPTFVGFRPDVEPTEVRRELVVPED